MMKLLRKIKVNESGASAAEYALIVAVLGGAVIAAATAFGTKLTTAMGNTGSAVVAASPTTFP